VWIISKIRNSNLLGLASGVIYALTTKIITVVNSKITKKDPNGFSKNRTTKKTGRVIINELIGIIKGYIIAHVVVKTGRRHAPVKGVGLGVFYWLGANGLTKKAELFKDMVAGAVSGLFVKQFGDEELFSYEVPKLKKHYKILRIKRRSR